MTRTIRGDPDGRSLRVAVLVARWNTDITDRLLEGALDVLALAETRDVAVIEVPGAFELPQAAARLAASGSYDAIVALGCLLTGETVHDRVIADACAHGLMDVAIRSRLPVTFGVITGASREQAMARSDPANDGKGGHKGREAATAALALATALARAEPSS